MNKPNSSNSTISKTKIGKTRLSHHFVLCFLNRRIIATGIFGYADWEWWFLHLSIRKIILSLTLRSWLFCGSFSSFQCNRHRRRSPPFLKCLYLTDGEGLILIFIFVWKKINSNCLDFWNKRSVTWSKTKFLHNADKLQFENIHSEIQRKIKFWMPYFFSAQLYHHLPTMLPSQTSLDCEWQIPWFVTNICIFICP